MSSGDRWPPIMLIAACLSIELERRMRSIERIDYYARRLNFSSSFKSSLARMKRLGYIYIYIYCEYIIVIVSDDWIDDE